jgi:integrase
LILIRSRSLPLTGTSGPAAARPLAASLTSTSTSTPSSSPLLLTGRRPYAPRAISQRYRRLAVSLKLRSTRLHSLRHYSATELVAAGVDIRTVAGRLGHGSGGATTLRVYAAWVEEADRRASETMAAIVPRPHVVAPAASPYERVAEGLRAQIRVGILKPGDQLPTVAELAVANAVAMSTAHRAVALLRVEGLIDVARGRRSRVVEG